MSDFHGKKILVDICKAAGFTSISHLVAANTLFTHPDTVQITKNKNLFRTIRDFPKRGKMIDWKDNKQVMCCDNEGPTRTFVWANNDFNYSDVQFNHIYSDSSNVEIYTSLANICVTPAFLAKLTDTDEEIKNLLKYRSFKLYDFFQGLPPQKPEIYDQLKWKDFISPVNDLEATLIRRLKSCPKSRSAVSARQIGWYFSNYSPDSRF